MKQAEKPIHKLTRWEKRIQDDFLAGRYKDVPLTPAERKRFQQAASLPALVFMKDRSITLRINGADLQALRHRAHAEGKKYQTLIGEILHREAAAVLKAA